MIRMKLLASILGGTLALANFSQAADGDWPQWRGVQRDGISIETGLLKEWPANGPALNWKAAGIGAGYSGVAALGGRLYTMGENAEGSFVHALEAQSGKILWSTRLGKAGAPGWGGFAGPRATPTIDGEALYVLSQYGEFACLEQATGKITWQKSLVADLNGPMPEWGFAESPLVDGDKVICTPGGPKGTLAAFDKKTGAEIWRTKGCTDNAHYSSCIIAEIDGVRQYIQLTAAHVVGVGTDGKILWQAARKGEVAVIPTPIYKDHHVFVTSGYKAGCNLFKISKTGDAFQAEQVYAHKDFDNHHGGVVLIGEHLYGHSDKRGWVCQEFKTGKVVWAEKNKFKKGSICAAEGMLYLRAEEGDGAIVLAEATPAGFTEKSRFNQPARSSKNSWPHPVISQGNLYIRDQDVLLSYRIK